MTNKEKIFVYTILVISVAPMLTAPTWMVPFDWILTPLGITVLIISGLAQTMFFCETTQLRPGEIVVGMLAMFPYGIPFAVALLPPISNISIQIGICFLGTCILATIWTIASYFAFRYRYEKSRSIRI